MLPQIIFLALGFIGLGIDFAKHGKPKERKHNGWITLISLIITFLILWWGGFWEPML